MHKVNTDSYTLPRKQAEYFHSIVANLLWTTKRARQDIETAVSFLCTQVKSPTGQDKNKLKILLQFLNQTIDDRRVIGTGLLIDLLTWIYPSYVVQPDMNSHTGGAMSLGWGLIHCR